jgi:hypothetical protein
VVEIECLRGRNNELIIKELALYNEKCFQVYFFRPPYDECRWQRLENHWIRNNLNGIHWYDGDVSYYKLKKIASDIARTFPTIYTKGSEKTTLLSNLMNANVYNLDDYNTPKHKVINSQFTRCQFHYTRPQSSCSVEKAMKYYGWLKKQEEENERTTTQERIVPT